MAPKRTLDSLDSSEPVVCRKPLYHAPSPTGSGDTPRKSKKRKTQTSMNQSPNDLTKQQNFNLSNFIDLTEMESVPPRSRAPRKSKHFRFMDLPAELRREVYQHLLPNGMRISFHWRYPRNSNDESHPNCINGQIWYMKSTDKEGKRYWGPRGATFPKTESNLFLVNKFVSNEARAVLYGENLFSFTIDDRPHYPRSLKAPQIFGIFGSPDRLPLLRNMRNIEMVIEARRHDHWAMKRHRSRLEYFVSVLKQYADDDNQKSLLTYLQIKYERPHSDTWAGNLHYQKQHMYGLESLASLQGIKHVDVEGEHLPDWYAKCLQICINGTGGDVLPIDYPDIKIKKRIPGFHKRYEMVWQTTRAWHHPILNWDEYAERNGVDMPAGGVYVDLTES